jgi:hypothetical protein
MGKLQSDSKSADQQSTADSWLSAANDANQKANSHLFNAGWEVLDYLRDNAKANLSVAGFALASVADAAERITNHVMTNPRALAELGLPPVLIVDGMISGKTADETKQLDSCPGDSVIGLPKGDVKQMAPGEALQGKPYYNADKAKAKLLQADSEVSQSSSNTSAHAEHQKQLETDHKQALDGGAKQREKELQKDSA